MKLSNCILTHIDFWNVKHPVAVSFRSVGEIWWFLFLSYIYPWKVYLEEMDKICFWMERLLLSQRKAKTNLSSKVKKKLKSHLLETTDLRRRGLPRGRPGIWEELRKNHILILFFSPLLFLHQKTCDKTKFFLQCYLPFVALWLGQLFFPPDSHNCIRGENNQLRSALACLSLWKCHAHSTTPWVACL